MATDCELAGKLMMKFMDGVITDEEALQLNKHITTCELCREDFIIYDKIIQDFTTITLVEAPDDFVSKVMERVKSIPAPLVMLTSDRVLYGIWGFISVLATLGVVISLNKEYLLTALSSNSFFAPLATFLTTASYIVSEYSNEVTTSFQSFFTHINKLVYQYHIVFLFAAILLASIQVFLYRKKDVVEKVDLK